MSLLSEPAEVYIKYLELADEIHSQGFHLDKTLEELAELIYNQRKSESQNE